jgi:hypothetical protein
MLSISLTMQAGHSNLDMSLHVQTPETTSLIKYSTTVGFPFSTIKRPLPTYTFSSIALNSSAPVSRST